jgi:ribose/xylose/arabinose/galactoside ABC-type transport system permease subunit
MQDAYDALNDAREDIAELANIGMAHILAGRLDDDRGGTKSAIAIHDPLLLRLASRPELIGAILLVTVTTALLLATPTFATEENLLWVCYSFSVIGIATLGMLLVFAAADIDFAIGSEIGLAAIIAGRIVFFHPGTTGWLVFAAAIGSGLGFGFVNGLIVAKLKFNPFIATLATSFIGRGFVMVLSQNRNLSGFSPDLLFLGEGKTFGLPNLLIIFAALAVFWHLVLRRTVFGHQLYAIGGNPNAAYLSGAPVDRIRMQAYVLCGGLGGLAGFLLACRLGVAEQSLGIGYEMDSIAGAVIGGVSIFGGAGSVVGVVLGTAAMAVIRNGLVLLQIGASWQTLLTGAVIVIAVAIDGVRRRIRSYG